ncbi:MAG: hypothetical protein QHI38_06675 [Armatimonadota bacterium]|nr:hypothetical protein [Armatimonadota bacterium]
MASSKKGGHEQLDELLVELRDRTLAENETVVAQAQGDHGQAVVLTSQRVLVLKAGLTATGKIDGVVIGEFPFSAIAAVKVRKGPLGAVIQICPAVQDALTQSDVPNNIVVFTGPQRVKKCEWIATRIESAMGKPLERTEAPVDEDADRVIPDFDHEPASTAPREEHAVVDDLPAALAEEEPVQSSDETATAAPFSDEFQQLAETPPRDEITTSQEKPQPRRRPARSLADEIYAEVLEARTSVSADTGSEIQSDGPVQEAQEGPRTPENRPEQDIPETQQIQEVQQTPSEVSADTLALNEAADIAEHVSDSPIAQQSKQKTVTNPRLPKPVVRRAKRDKALTLLALLFVGLIAGIAAIAPSRYTSSVPSEVPAHESASQDVQLLRKHLQKITEYKENVSAHVARAVEYLQTVESAARCGDRAALASLAAQPRLDEALTRLEALDAPVGLAAAKEQILLGLALARTAVVKLSVGQQPSGGTDLRSCLREIGEAKAKLIRGLNTIDAVRAEIERRGSIGTQTPAGSRRSLAGSKGAKSLDPGSR